MRRVTGGMPGIVIAVVQKPRLRLRGFIVFAG
jgi:hypothetical protein